MNIQDLKSNTTWQEASNTINNNNNKISLAIATLENAKLKNKGYFTSVEKLNEAIPNPAIGSKAYVGTSEPYAIYIVENGAWVDSGYTGGDEIVAKITTDRIEDGAVTSEKIATSAFDSTLSVSGKIAPANVVGEKLSELDRELYGKVLNQPTELYNGSYTASGTYINSTNHYCICDVSKFVGEKISASNATQYGFCSMWEHGKNVVWVNGRQDGKPNQITIPSGAKYLYIYVFNNTDVPQISVTGEYNGFIKNTEQNITNLQSSIGKVDALEVELTGKYIKQATELKDGSLNASGVWSSNSNKFCLVDVSNFVGSVINVSPISKVIQWGFLRDFTEQVGGDFINGRQTTSTNPPTNVVVPGETKYIYLYLGVYTDIPSVQSPDEVEGIKEKVDAISASPSMFFEKTATSMTIYIKTKGQNMYIAYPFKYAKSDFSSDLYPCFFDCWSINKPYSAHLANGKMNIHIELFFGGVSELAIDTVCGDNSSSQVHAYVGSNKTHGFENITNENGQRSFRVMLDRQAIYESDIVGLQECKSVEVIQNTDLYQAYTNTSPFAKVLKTWNFDIYGMTITTRVTILRSLLISNAQFGMFCVYRRGVGEYASKYITNRVYKDNNPFAIYNIEDGWENNEDNKTIKLPDPNCNKITEWGECGYGFSLSISDTNKTSGNGMFVQNNGGINYNKMYFNYGSNFTPNVGDVLYATQRWTIE